MKSSLILSVLVSISSLAFARDPNCDSRLDAAEQAITKAQDAVAIGEATHMDVLTAKLAHADVFYTCVLFVKYQYCNRRITLLNSLLEGVQQEKDAGQKTQADVDQAQNTLNATIDFCIHPDRTQL